MLIGLVRSVRESLLERRFRGFILFTLWMVMRLVFEGKCKSRETEFLHFLLAMAQPVCNFMPNYFFHFGPQISS